MRIRSRKQSVPLMDRLPDLPEGAANPKMPVAGAAGFALLGAAILRRRRQQSSAS
jgi:MYXO-CTERM domain-containing protein